MAVSDKTTKIEGLNPSCSRKLGKSSAQGGNNSSAKVVKVRCRAIELVAKIDSAAVSRNRKAALNTFSDVKNIFIPVKDYIREENCLNQF